MVAADAAEALAEVVIPDITCDPPNELLLLLTAAGELDTPGPPDDTACWVWVAADMTCALVVAAHKADTLAPDVADVA